LGGHLPSSAVEIEGKVEPACVRALLRLLSLFPLGSLVALSDGSVAQTFRANGEDFNNPIVAVLLNAQGERLEPDDESVLLDLAQSELTIVQTLPKPCREMVTTEERAVSAWDYCLDKQAHDQRTVDRESAAQDSVDHDSINQPTVDQDSMDQDSVDHDSIDQEAVAT